MNRETLKKIDRFLTFGDIKPKVDETDCYYITDQAMQKVIDGLTEEKLQLERQIIADRLIEIKNRAGQVEPEVIVKLADEGRIIVNNIMPTKLGAEPLKTKKVTREEIKKEYGDSKFSE